MLFKSDKAVEPADQMMGQVDKLMLGQVDHEVEVSWLTRGADGVSWV